MISLHGDLLFFFISFLFYHAATEDDVDGDVRYRERGANFVFRFVSSFLFCVVPSLQTVRKEFQCQVIRFFGTPAKLLAWLDFSHPLSGRRFVFLALFRSA